MTRQWFLPTFLLGLTVLVFVVVLIEPTLTIVGLVRGDSFYHMRSASYWQRVIAADGASSQISQATLDAFDSDTRAIPLLKDCLAHPDPNIRRPSIVLFQRCAFYHDQVIAFRGLLDDPDQDVRFQSVCALGRLRREALSAIPRLSQLTRSSDPNIAFAAKHALWNIDPESARRAERWAKYTSALWDFSVDFPGEAERDLRTEESIDADIHEFSAWSGTSRFAVALSFVRPDVESTVAERYEMAAGFTADAVNGDVEHNTLIEQCGLVGRDQKIIVADHILRARVFVVGNRVYQAQVVYMPGQLHSEAVEYFLASLVVNWRPES
ncbi:MAG: HEAT repeat domain-containing protein [Rhodopirellula sp.]|nr:HEAT repeat domain-containing protein [Rhodopirellula sp.]